MERESDKWLDQEGRYNAGYYVIGNFTILAYVSNPFVNWWAVTNLFDYHQQST